MAGPSSTAIYTGRVAHTRLAPRRRSFDYPVYMLHLDLAELESESAATEMFGRSRWFSARRPAPARIRREDFYGDPARPLSEEIRDLVESETGARPAGPISLLANPRTWGYQFNPIAVYYCFDATGDRLTHVVADVTNMPWRESHAYVFAADAAGTLVDGTAEKQMHVSPYLEMDYVYRLTAPIPGQALRLTVRNSREGKVEFSATLRLARRAPTAANLRRTLIRFPASAVQVTARIFWQALRMRLAGFTWFPKQPPKNDARAAEIRKTEGEEAQREHATAGR